MEFGSWIFSNKKVNVQLSKISMLFSSNVKVEGDETKGKITLVSEQQHDDVWGPVATVDITWEKKPRTQYHHGLKVKETIRMFSSIEVVATKKETQWLLSHEMTYWFGTRQQFKFKRYYPTNLIHGVVYCDVTERLYEFHAVCTANNYAKYEQPFLEMMFSLACHE
jgi:hypothetical protein